jgi:hypothetical protein
VDNPKWHAFTLEEMKAQWAREHAERLKTLAWGGWKLDPKLLTLTFDGYEVDLEELTDSAQILDGIFQVRGKTWVTPEVMADFLEAVNDLLHPQANYCSMGVGKTCDPAGAVKAFLTR